MSPRNAEIHCCRQGSLWARRVWAGLPPTRVPHQPCFLWPRAAPILAPLGPAPVGWGLAEVACREQRGRVWENRALTLSVAPDTLRKDVLWPEGERHSKFTPAVFLASSAGVLACQCADVISRQPPRRPHFHWPVTTQSGSQSLAQMPGVQDVASGSHPWKRALTCHCAPASPARHPRGPVGRVPQ